MALFFGDIMLHLKWFILLIIPFLTTQAFGNIPGLSSAYSAQLLQTRNLIVEQQLLPDITPPTCYQQLFNISSDNEMRITMAFGYMDVTQGEEFIESSFYQNGDVLDRDAKLAFEGVLNSKCLKDHNYACGFKRSGQQWTKNIRNRLTGQTMKVILSLLSPSVSSNDSQNKSQLWSQQSQSSESVRQNFLSAFHTSDVVIYLGHARSGGGPDFYPPILNTQGLVHYPHYKGTQQGLKELLSSLGQTAKPTPVIGLLACKSTGLFANKVRQASPGSIVITADDLFNYNDILPTGFAMLESIISQRCSHDFGDVIRANPNSASMIDIHY